MVKGTGGKFRPQDPPSILDVPLSCLPTTKCLTKARSRNKEFLTQSYFDKYDKFLSFSEFDPRSNLRKYDNILCNADPDKIVSVFLSDDQTERPDVITVLNQTALSSPATSSAFKKGIKAHRGGGLEKILKFFLCLYNLIGFFMLFLLIFSE